jgi:hypothetical protein
MNLDNFESLVDAQIVSRGKKYHKDGNVLYVEESSDNLWVAEVDGTETYNVEITLENREITDHFCDCPYDGEVCKHTVAVLYELRTAVKTKKIQVRETKSKKLTVESLLDKTDSRELKNFIIQYSQKNKDFTNHLFLHFAEKDERIDVKEKYRELVKKVVKENTDRSGFADYNKANKLGRQVAKLIKDNGSLAFANGNYKEAFAIGQVVLEELTDLLENSDDSNGEIGGAVSDAIRIMDDVAQSPEIAMEFREQIFDYLAKQGTQKVYFNYGDYGLEVMDVLLRLAPKISNPYRFIELVDRLIPQYRDRSFDFHTRRFTEYKIKLLNAIGKSDDANQLMEANIVFPEIRKIFVDKAIQNDELEKAKTLIKNGIFEAEKLNHSGTVRSWEEQLLAIAQKENDKNWIEYYAKKFYFSGYDNARFYQIWKSCFSAEDWKVEIERVIQQIIKEEQAKKDKHKSDYLFVRMYNDNRFHRLLPIYLEEKYYDRLLTLTQELPLLANIQQVHNIFKKMYPEELTVLYKEALEKWAMQLEGTGDYSKFCNLLIKIKKDVKGSETMVNKIVEDVANLYPKRPSLQKELKRV